MAKKCPKGVICIENYTIVFILILIFGLLYYVFSQNQYVHYTESQPNNMLFSHYHNNNPPHIHKLSPNHIGIHSSHPMFNLSSQSGYDMLRPIMNPSISYVSNQNDTLMNPYSPPVQYNEPHSYKQIGYLKSNTYGNKLFPIFAKPVHLRRDKWYYYTIFDNIKLPIYSNGRKCSSEHGCDSLSNGDIVQLENMNEQFVVNTYDNNTLTYDPVI
jgi:hypothetical protein